LSVLYIQGYTLNFNPPNVDSHLVSLGQASQNVTANNEVKNLDKCSKVYGYPGA